MLLYRIFPHLSGASSGQSGHAAYLFPGRGYGRWDNRSHYLGWYLASSATGAVGEAFGHLHTWSGAMFDFPGLPGATRALATYAVPDDLPLLAFDNANNLAQRSLRPTEIVSPNRSATQKIALDVFNEVKADGSPTWSGLSWWSSRRSLCPVHVVWGVTPACQQVDPLDVDHPAVQDAAQTLSKPFA